MELRVIQDGLIYVVDLRNGLYVLEYRGAYEDEVSRIKFLDGNSNQGDALCYDPVGAAPEGLLDARADLAGDLEVLARGDHERRARRRRRR